MIAYIWFVLIYYIAFILVHTGLLLLAAIELRRYAVLRNAGNLRRLVRSPLAPRITILVPAYNEASVIADSVRALLALDYPELELVVINDGSSDGTMERLTEVFDLRPVTRPVPPVVPHEPIRGLYAPASKLRLLVIDKNNGGKADSLNAGINYASHPIICTIDADSILEPDGLAKAVLPFVDDPRRTVATGGMVRIANGCRIERGRMMEVHLPRSRFAMFQVVEYARAFFGTRTGWTALNGLLIVSGAFGLFRRDVMIEAGGYRTGTVGEDLELVVRLHRFCRDARRPYRILYVPDPVCWTEGPERARFLRSQRRRWHRACVEILMMHWRMFGNPRYRAVGLLGLPSLVIFELMGPFIEMTGYVVSAISLLLGLIGWTTFILFLALSILYGLFLTIGAITLEDATANRYPSWHDLGRVLLFAVGENFGYRQLTHIWRIEGIWQIFRKPEWGAMERTGLSATEPPAGPGSSAGPD